MLTLNNLKSPKGAHKNTKRLGRGQASGQGTQSGKGHKGQKCRSGGGVRPGFEGGAMPIYMRLPKRGFKNAPFKLEYAILNLSQINDKLESGEVTKKTLIDSGLLKGKQRAMPVKVLGNGKLDKALTFVNIDKFSKTAQDLIVKAGGSVITK
ncbi:MAG: 50S ribosomal protein L15 [Bacteriovoracaceae bacterium]|nr:50S ribosomal protein L15 [Bacteriovoracaceae bacterium]